MSPQHSRQFSRRRFLRGMTLAGTAALPGFAPEPAGAELAPERTRLRLVQVPTICQAPQYVAEELLHSKDFTDLQYMNKQGTAGILNALLHRHGVQVTTRHAYVGPHWLASVTLTRPEEA
jgi:NitT/TauT family transport system substrate-binding protein